VPCFRQQKPPKTTIDVDRKNNVMKKAAGRTKHERKMKMDNRSWDAANRPTMPKSFPTSFRAKYLNLRARVTKPAVINADIRAHRESFLWLAFAVSVVVLLLGGVVRYSAI
jgi:hypothetical protein